MIKGIGVDLCQISRIENIYLKNIKLANKVLTTEPFSILMIAKKWAVMEALAKATQLGIGAIGFKNVTLTNMLNGAPYLEFTPEGLEIISTCFGCVVNVFVTISHEADMIVAVVVIDG